MGTANVTQAVWEELDQDPLSQAALRRGVLNAHALARQLKDRLGLDASIPGIVSAIKRYPLDGSRQRAQRAQEALTDVRVATRTQIACVGLRQHAQALSILPRLLKEIHPGPGDTLRVSQGEQALFVCLDARHLQTLLDLVAPDEVLFVHRDLAELSVREPAWTQTVPGPLFLLTGALYAQGINIWHLFGTGTEVHVLIHQHDLSAAHQTLLRIGRRTLQDDPPSPHATH